SWGVVPPTPCTSSSRLSPDGGSVPDSTGVVLGASAPPLSAFCNSLRSPEIPLLLPRLLPRLTRRRRTASSILPAPAGRRPSTHKPREIVTCAPTFHGWQDGGGDAAAERGGGSGDHGGRQPQSARGAA